jgi:mannosyltransferase OCH1-like enzyme
MEKIIHQLWVGKYLIPEKDYAFTKGIKEANPSFDYKFWNNYNLPILPDKIEQLRKLYTKHEKWVELADMLRYYLVYQYGGLYIDCDYESVAPFDGLDGYEGFVSLVFNKEDITICNSMFAFRKGHPLMEYICDEMYNNCNVRWLGPHFFGEKIKNYLGLNADAEDDIVKERLEAINIKVIDRNTERPNFAIHHYSYTWSEENKEKMKIDPNFKSDLVTCA